MTLLEGKGSVSWWIIQLLPTLWGALRRRRAFSVEEVKRMRVLLAFIFGRCEA